MDLQTALDNLPPCDDENLHKAACDALSRIFNKGSNLKPSCEMGAHLYGVKIIEVITEVKKALPENFLKDRALTNATARHNRLSAMKKARQR